MVETSVVPPLRRAGSGGKVQRVLLRAEWGGLAPQLPPPALVIESWTRSRLPTEATAIQTAAEGQPVVEASVVPILRRGSSGGGTPRVRCHLQQVSLAAVMNVTPIVVCGPREGRECDTTAAESQPVHEGSVVPILRQGSSGGGTPRVRCHLQRGSTVDHVDVRALGPRGSEASALQQPRRAARWSRRAWYHH